MDNPFVQRAEPHDVQLIEEIVREQVVHVPLDQYQPGCPHYERLMQALENNLRFTFPSSMETNV